jgi:hypothetical protein
MIKKKNRTNFCAFLICLLFCSNCSEENVKPDPKPEPEPSPVQPNRRPSIFSVQVSEIRTDQAIITWNGSVDLDNDSIFYKVFFEETLVSTEPMLDTAFTLRNLKPLQTYIGYVEATDKKSEPVKVPFSFRTKSKVTVFSKLFPTLGGDRLILSDDGGFVTSLGLNKFDSLGNVIFASRINPPSHGPMYTDLIQSSDGGYLFCNRFEIQKFDKDGNYLWTSEGFHEYTVYNSVVELPDGGYLAVGNSVTLGGIIQKFGANGKKVWLKNYDQYAPQTIINCTSIKRTSDGGYIIAGTSGSGLEILSISKIDSEGNIHWIKTYQGNVVYVVDAHVLQASDGSIIVGSKTMAYDNQYGAMVVKFSEEGELIWDKLFYIDGLDTELNSIIQLRTGEYVFAGSLGYYQQSALMVKLNTSGDIIGMKIYNPGTMDYLWRFNGIQQTDDGGFIFIGGKGYINNGNERGFWLLKTDDEGNF